MEPTEVKNGLAIYETGAGEPLLLMPYPHGYTRTRTADGGLFDLLAVPGRRVVTFDPPGAYASTRSPSVGMPEMLACAEEVIAARGLPRPVDVVGHSMGGLCALALAVERPELVKRLVIIDGLTGGPAIRRHRAMPYSWGYLNPAFWGFVWRGGKISRGRGTLRDHKILQRLVMNASYHDRGFLTAHLGDIGPDRPEDRHQPPPPRDIWPVRILRLDYARRLGEVKAATLVMTGHYDPQVPESAAREIATDINGAQLAVFKDSGHYPYLEEPDRFIKELTAFLKAAVS